MADPRQTDTNKTALIKCISAGLAHTFELPFDADKVTVYNLTDWETTSALPISTWFKDETLAGYSYSQRVIVDSGSTGEKNFSYVSSNGFTSADLDGGAPQYRALITGVSQADPCVVTCAAGLWDEAASGQIVRITDLGNEMPVPRGMSELNGNRYTIEVLSSTTFALRDVVSGDFVDSTGFEAYVAGGRVDLESRTQLRAQSQWDTPFVYDPKTYRLTIGSAVMGSDNDVLWIEVVKFGQVEDLGDLA